MLEAVVTTSNAARQRRHRRHRRGDHTLCLPGTCASAGTVQPISRPSVADSAPQYLYRFFDATGQLLYVGITCNLGRRFKAHRLEQPWWPEVARTVIDRYADRGAVEQAEREAIETERPRWNVVHNHSDSPRPSPDMAPVRSRLRIVRDGVEIELESDAQIELLASVAVDVWQSLRNG